MSYCTVSTPQVCMDEETTQLSIQLSLNFNTSYVVSVRALGTSGDGSTVSSQVLFTTAPAGT